MFLLIGPILTAIAFCSQARSQETTSVYSFPYPKEAKVSANATYDLAFVDCYFVLAASVDSLEGAKVACRSKGGARVAVFRSASEYHSVISQLDWDSVPGFQGTDKWIGQLWTGLQRSSPSDDFRWIDNSPIDLDQYGDAILPDDVDTISTGGELNCAMSRSQGLVASSCRTNVTAGVFCQTTTYDRKLEVTLPSVVDEMNFCRTFLLPSAPYPMTIVSVPGYVRKTFFTVEGVFTWAEAQRACELVEGPDELNTSLAVISSITEYHLLRGQPHFMTFESKGYWVGLRRHPDGLRSPLDEDGIAAAFLWLDGTPLNYFAFIPHRPARNAGIEKCVAIAKDEYGSTGYNDYRCLVADENGDIPDWIDDDDQCFGALCQYGVEWL